MICPLSPVCTKHFFLFVFFNLDLQFAYTCNFIVADCPLLVLRQEIATPQLDRSMLVLPHMRSTLPSCTHGKFRSPLVIKKMPPKPHDF